MNAIQQVIVVGVYPNERERDYTSPGYEACASFVCDKLKPQIDAEYRTLPGPATTAVMGSSLGGVASLYLAWSRPEIFGSERQERPKRAGQRAGQAAARGGGLRQSNPPSGPGAGRSATASPS